MDPQSNKGQNTGANPPQTGKVTPPVPPKAQGATPPTGQPLPQAGQPMPQGGVHQGAYPPPAYPQGYYPQDPNMYPPQGMPQGGYPPAYPQGYYPQDPNMYPPQGGYPYYPPQGMPQGGYPPQGQMPQGAYPPAGFPPQGQMPQGAYGAGMPPVQGGGMPPITPEDTTPANFQLGAKLPPKLNVKVPKHPLNFDEDYFVRLLAGSISLSKDEKKKIVESVPKLKQSQVDELIRIFEEEKQKFAALSKKHVSQLEKLAEQHYKEWMDLETEFYQDNKKKEDTNKAEDIRKKLGL